MRELVQKRGFKMTTDEYLHGAAILGGMMFAIMFGASFALKFFVALNAPPMRRTIWTVGIAYLVSLAFFWFGGLPDYELWAAIAGLPFALLLGWMLFNEFKERWVDDGTDLAPGVTLSNTDWRAGIFILVGLVALASIKVLLRGDN